MARVRRDTLGHFTVMELRFATLVYHYDDVVSKCPLWLLTKLGAALTAALAAAGLRLNVTKSAAFVPALCPSFAWDSVGAVTDLDVTLQDWSDWDLVFLGRPQPPQQGCDPGVDAYMRVRVALLAALPPRTDELAAGAHPARAFLSEAAEARFGYPPAVCDSLFATW